MPLMKAIEARLEATRNELALKYLPLVKVVASRIREHLPVHVDPDDLISSGILGLLDAASKFNPEKQVSFPSYAKHRIKGAILDSLRQLDWASRDMRRNQKKVDAVKEQLRAAYSRNPTEAEIAEALDIAVERFRKLQLDLVSCFGALSTRHTLSDLEEELPDHDLRAGPEVCPDAICLNDELESFLRSALEILPRRHRQVMTLYYNAEMTMKEIGKVLGVNESRVSQMHTSAMEKLRAHLSERKMTRSAFA